MTALTRRRLLGGAAGLATAAALDRAAMRPAAADPLALAVESRSIAVKGRAATVFAIRRPDGAPGIVLDPGQRFALDLVNRCGEPTLIHWHGQTPPIAQDGVPGLSRDAMQPGDSGAYDFAPREGTHWMHSHHGLQEMQLMAAPLIVRSVADQNADRQEVTLLLHDFSFTPPAELLAAASAMMAGAHTMPGGAAMPAMPGMPAMPSMPAMPAHQGHGGGAMPAGMDLNDVDFDAYLANDRTLDDPQVVRIERGGRVLLRIINGAAATVFHIDIGGRTGTLVAVDGNAVAPIPGRRFGIAMGQRLDISLDLPRGESAWPVLAQREGDRIRTGIVLATAGAAVRRIADRAEVPAPAFADALEQHLRAHTPLAPRRADRVHRIALTGAMSPYAWSIDGKRWPESARLPVKQGERVEIEMRNTTAMSHPMHLHGHHFQVVAIDGRRFAGAVRDTVLVPPARTMTVAFDADNPGEWLLHCHNLLHMATGMMTAVKYE
jgi:FtsP/CotA-like multicopper oxidase with cupredoxin domain